MRLYMFGGVLAIMSRAGLFGLTHSPHDGGAGSAQVVLIHHAPADQGTDGADLRFGDCLTQRNLSEAGRGGAEALGGELGEHGLLIPRGLLSPFFRARGTPQPV